MKFIPARDLQTVDALWRAASGGRFGYSVQKELWIQNRRYWEKFFKAIDWVQVLTPLMSCFELASKHLKHLTGLSAVRMQHLVACIQCFTGTCCIIGRGQSGGFLVVADYGLTSADCFIRCWLAGLKAPAHSQLLALY